jgi:hypothetical protein
MSDDKDEFLEQQKLVQDALDEIMGHFPVDKNNLPMARRRIEQAVSELIGDFQFTPELVGEVKKEIYRIRTEKMKRSPVGGLPKFEFDQEVDRFLENMFPEETKSLKQQPTNAAAASAKPTAAPSSSSSSVGSKDGKARPLSTQDLLNRTKQSTK